jgi:hypothetical protein
MKKEVQLKYFLKKSFVGNLYARVKVLMRIHVVCIRENTLLLEILC